MNRPIDFPINKAEPITARKIGQALRTGKAA